MFYCEKCGIHVSGSGKRCPLCQGELAGTPEEDAYPVIEEARTPCGLIIRMALFLTVAALAVCIAINYCFPESGWWFLFVAAGLASVWLVIGIALSKRRNPLKAIVWLLAVVSVLLLVWDWRTGSRGWSINFVLPILIPCMQIAVVATAWALHLRASDYLLSLGISLFAGFLPLIPLLCQWLWMVYPSVICVSFSVILLAALVLFQGSALKAELIRRTHI